MQKFLFRQAANLLQAFEPRLNILMYHRVMPEPDPLRPWETDRQEFRKQMEWISNVFDIIPLSEAIENLKTGTLKRRCLSITFDDGYLDNATEALPILKDFGFLATFFCTSAWLEGGLMWNDLIIEAVRRWPKHTISIAPLDLDNIPVGTLKEKNRAIELILPNLKYVAHANRREIAETIASKVPELPELMMRPHHVQLLSNEGMEIGGHTHSHPIMANLSDSELTSEIQTNKNILETTLQSPIKLFAYPNGKPGTDYRQDQIPHIKDAGYIASVTTERGAVPATSELFELPRFTPWNKSSFKYLATLVSNGSSVSPLK